MPRVLSMGFSLCLLCLGVFCSPFTFAYDDEPDELSWDHLGGTLSGFRHFMDYAKGHPEFSKKLIAETPSNGYGRDTDLPDEANTIWLTPEAFHNAKVNQWDISTVENRSVITYGAGHGSGRSCVRITVPKSGFYRVWAEYWHEQGKCGSFGVRIEDPMFADRDYGRQTTVQDVYSWSFDFVELHRKVDILPTHQEEPSGFIWESTPMIWLAAGDYSLTIGSMIQGEPLGMRRVASVVLTEEPLAIPAKPEGEGVILTGKAPVSEESRAAADYWNHRPVDDGTNAALLSLWYEWRKAFFNDLAEHNVPGIEGRRMASQVAFDPESNLVGTPLQIRDEKNRMAKLLKYFQEKKPAAFKIEGEEFRPVTEGWTIEGQDSQWIGSARASESKLLFAKADEKLAESEFIIDIPREGDYAVWCRYLKFKDTLAPFRLRLTDSEGNTVEYSYCDVPADLEEGKSYDLLWQNNKVHLAKGSCRIVVVKGGEKKMEGKVREPRFDEVYLTDDLSWGPSESDKPSEIVLPFDSKEFSVWRADSTWQPFSRLSVPRSGENLLPYTINVPQGGVGNVVLHIRNNSAVPSVFKPEILDDPAHLVSWRIPAYQLSPEFGWQPMVLLERSSLTVPPGETASVWLTIDGQKPSKDENVQVRIAGETFSLKITRQGNIESAPVPYVGGWSSPYERVSCWDMYKRIGMNVITSIVVTKELADRYGIRLFIILGDTDVSREHIAETLKCFHDCGIDKKDWAWSFMDEPGDSRADLWVDYAKKFKEVDPTIQIWCNPGEVEGATSVGALKMVPYVDCYCPYVNHFFTDGGGSQEYKNVLDRKKYQFNILLTYTTPCNPEKAPAAPMDMFFIKDYSLKYHLDGWLFFAFTNYYGYCNSMWDEVYAYHPDQAVSLYAGSGLRTLGTRNSEAIREAVMLWRQARQTHDNRK